MGRSPLAHPLHIIGAAEMIAVLWLAQPAAVTFSVTGGATLRLGAKLLVPPIAQIGIKQLFAVQTLLLIRLRHGAC
jgi:hypothetical protein